MPENKGDSVTQNPSQKSQPSGQQKTGPATGGARGNDMPSQGGTQKDGRGAEGGQGQGGQSQSGQAPGAQTQQAQRQGQPGRQTNDEDRNNPANVGNPGRSAQPKSGQAGASSGQGGDRSEE